MPNCRLVFLTVLLGSSLAVAAPVTPQPARAQTLSRVDKLTSARERPRIVLMQPDIAAAMVTVAGTALPRADWTAAAQKNLRLAARAEADRRGIELVLIDSAQPPEPDEKQYLRLHAAVGGTINDAFSLRKIPSKGGQLDWSLGPGVTALARRYDADYALFLTYRTIASSTGRQTMRVATLGLVNSGPYEPDAKVGFVSLVDLRNGDIVWFRRASSLLKDVWDQRVAADVTRALFKGFPET